APRTRRPPLHRPARARGRAAATRPDRGLARRASRSGTTRWPAPARPRRPGTVAGRLLFRPTAVRRTLRRRQRAPPQDTSRPAGWYRTSGLIEQCLDERLRLERGEDVGTFPEADQLDRNAEFALHLEDDAALGGPVQLGQHDAGHVDDVGEHPGLDQPVLAGSGV